MRKCILVFFLLITLSSIAQDLTTLFEKSGGTESPAYPEIVSWWRKLDAAYPTVKMLEMGPTDSGFPLHLILVSTDKNFDIPTWKRQKRNIVLINNGIHPGEPDGIDASMLLARDIAQKKYKLPGNIILAFIPVYNIGGALNRSANYRIDQNGPIEKGFRGNAQNLDLNRDFIKMDSKNAFSFAQIYHLLDPDIFIDNHVSNGADYQHVMTLLVSQHNKLGGKMGEFMNRVFEPSLYPLMKTKGYDLVPYVNHSGETPDKGWPEFWDSPRYSSGYATLWNTFAFMPETHMLKPYKQRVEATKALMECFIEFTIRNGKQITALRKSSLHLQQEQTSFPLAWKLDQTKKSDILFKGYESGFKKSRVSGLNRLFYDRQKPYEKMVPFSNYYIDTLRVEKPFAYLIPQGWWKIIERLQANGIKMQRLRKDSIIDVEAYRIQDYTTAQRPFEGHHINSRVQLTRQRKKVPFRKGDYWINFNQPGCRFLLETLEPNTEDSYFAWNFFDTILGQKENYSDYVFEEIAADYLEKNVRVKDALAKNVYTDQQLAAHADAQLDFVYKNSPFYEPAHMTYPVYRVVK